MLRHLFEVGFVNRVLVAGVLCAPPADRMDSSDVKRQAYWPHDAVEVQQRPVEPWGLSHGDEVVWWFAPRRP